MNFFTSNKNIETDNSSFQFNSAISKKGWVSKRGRSFIPNWKKRYLVIKNHKLEYYTSEDMSRNNFKGEYILDPETVLVKDIIGETSEKYQLVKALEIIKFIEYNDIQRLKK